VVFVEGSSLIVFCYLSAFEIWPDKSGVLSGQISDAMRQQNTTKLLPSRETTPLIRSDFICNETAKYY
jgi:hypothetical protein